VSVRDSGPGIAPEHLDRFYRIEQSRSRELGGTGLAIARLLAQLQGAEVTVESKLGGGSTFTVWLPEATAPGSPLSAGRRGGPGEAATGPRVLTPTQAW